MILHRRKGMTPFLLSVLPQISRVFALSQYISTASGRRTRLLTPFSPVSFRFPPKTQSVSGRRHCKKSNAPHMSLHLTEFACITSAQSAHVAGFYGFISVTKAQSAHVAGFYGFISVTKAQSAHV